MVIFTHYMVQDHWGCCKYKAVIWRFSWYGQRTIRISPGIVLDVSIKLYDIQSSRLPPGPASFPSFAIPELRITFLFIVFSLY